MIDMKKILTCIIILLLMANISFVAIAVNDQPPDKPTTPSGPPTANIGDEYIYTSSATNPSGNNVSIQFSFGGDGTSAWSAPVSPGEPASMAHTWNNKGTFLVTAVAKDTFTGLISEVSDPLSVSVAKAKDKCLPSNTEPEEDPLIEQPLVDEPTDESDPEESTTCFLADTKIVTYNPAFSLASEQVYYKNIQEIKIGDKVISLNPETNELAYSTVTEIFHHTADEMKDGYLIINKILKITSNHPVFVNDRYITAGELKIGDIIFGVKITSIEHISAKEDSYNIMVEPYNNYLIPVGDTQSDILPTDSGGFKIEQIMIFEPPIAPTTAPGFGLFGDKNNLVESSTTSQPAQTTIELEASTIQTETIDIETSETMTVEMEMIETETTTIETGNLLI